MLTKNVETMKAEVAKHIEADAVIQGSYWRADPDYPATGGRGCFIGCLAHSSDASKLTEMYGLPAPLVRIAEGIFEGLPRDGAREFFAAIPPAIGRDGRDLSRVHWAFLADTLRHLHGTTGNAGAAVDTVIAGMDRLAAGEEWPAAARAADAARAAYAAYAARAAAYAAAYAARAADAADAAAYAAEIERQRDVFLKLVSEA